MFDCDTASSSFCDIATVRDDEHLKKILYLDMKNVVKCSVVWPLNSLTTSNIDSNNNVGESESFFSILSYYEYLLTAPLNYFLSSAFVNRFVKQGSLLAYSKDTNIDHCNAISIIDGVLYLNVDKDTYEVLGIIGKPIFRSALQMERYLIEINLLEERFQAGKKYYDRILAHLTTLRLDDITLRAVWIVDGAERSIIDELTTLASVERPRSYTRQEAACQSRVINRIRVPDVDAIPTRVVGKTIDRRDDAIVELDETYAELLEWAGAVATGFTLPIDRSIGSFNVDDAFVSDWLLPNLAPLSNDSNAVRLWQCTHIFHHSLLNNLMSELRVSTRSNWCCVLLNCEASANEPRSFAACIVVRRDGVIRIIRCGFALPQR